MHAISRAMAWMWVDSIKAVRTVHAHLHLSLRRETPETDWGYERETEGRAIDSRPRDLCDHTSSLRARGKE